MKVYSVIIRLNRNGVNNVKSGGLIFVGFSLIEHLFSFISSTVLTFCRSRVSRVSDFGEFTSLRFLLAFNLTSFCTLKSLVLFDHVKTC